MVIILKEDDSLFDTYFVKKKKIKISVQHLGSTTAEGQRKRTGASSWGDQKSTVKGTEKCVAQNVICYLGSSGK